MPSAFRLNHTMLQRYVGRLHKNVRKTSVLHDCPFEDVGNWFGRGSIKTAAPTPSAMLPAVWMFQSIVNLQAELGRATEERHPTEG